MMKQTDQHKNLLALFHTKNNYFVLSWLEFWFVGFSQFVLDTKKEKDQELSLISSSGVSPMFFNLQKGC